MSIDEKIRRIRLKKKIGKIVYGAVIIVVFCAILVNLDCTMKNEALKTGDVPIKTYAEVVTLNNTIKTPPPSETVTHTTSCASLTDAERHLVEGIVMAEARGESLEGMMAVAQVIKDRSDLWGKSVTATCTAPNQFAKPYKGEPSESVKTAVENVFENNMRVFEEPCTHFHANYVNPYWTSSKVSRGEIGSHKFYY